MVDPGPVIGRERELAALDQALGSARLLTLTGAGGCGKTRVALELADRAGLRAEPLDALVVELGSVRIAERVVDAVLRALGARERGGRTPMEVLLDSVAPRRALVVLDNCEHVIAEVRRLAVAVLDAAPLVSVLVTSREPLGCAREVVFRLAPLSLPDAGGGVPAIVRSDAGRFFVDRAAAADPGFALTPSTARAVVRICHELDGLPLALSLAAARVDRLAPGDIADGLSRRGRLAAASVEDVLPQHRSLRASLDWSHELLDEPERVLFRRLCAFAGGFTAMSARAVAMPEASETDVRAVLETFEAKGLIVPMAAKGRPRWAFLQTVAEYAAEQLELDDDIEQLRSRHLDWFLGYAAAADGLLLEPGGADRIDEEMPNLRLALEEAIERDASLALGIVTGLAHHWILAEHFDEARAASAAALAAAGTEKDAAARAVVHCGAALIATLREDYGVAVAELQRGLELAAVDADRESEARCLQLSSMVLILTGMDLDTGRKSANRAVELLRSSGDLLRLAFALVTVAFAEGLCDRFGAVHTAHEEFLAIPGASEHIRLKTWAELAVAWAEVVVGSPARALEHADVAIALEGGWPSMTHFVAVSHRMHALARHGRAAEAIEEGRQALARAQSSGAALAVPAIEMALVIAELADGDLASADARARRVVQVPQLHTAALMREALGRIALARGDAREAAVQAQELDALAERIGSPRQRALADLLKGCAAVLDGADDRGRDLLHTALAVHQQLGLECGAADVLEELAMLAADAGDGPRTAHLAAAAAAARARLGCVAPRPSIERLDAVRARFGTGDGGATWSTAWAEGAALGLADAIAYARRARGPRDRAGVGWSSLTPTERDVAELAATGLSNPQIATKLFMARSTVKMHLSSVYLKLNVANRTELARASAMRPVDGDQDTASTNASSPR
jgi:predicted ATPase/DNA-binding CsgD family transcriptional regulator